MLPLLNGLGALSIALAVTQSGVDFLDRRRGLVSGDDS
jgi:hypothetical protein